MFITVHVIIKDITGHHKKSHDFFQQYRIFDSILIPIYKNLTKNALTSGECNATHIFPPSNFLGVYLDRDFISEAYLFNTAHILRKV